MCNEIRNFGKSIAVAYSGKRVGGGDERQSSSQGQKRKSRACIEDCESGVRLCRVGIECSKFIS